MAMLLLEHARTLDVAAGASRSSRSDLDEEAIQSAGRLLPGAIAADVSEDRLRRFFVKEPGGYRVRREVREIVLFATHDLLKDPPFLAAGSHLLPEPAHLPEPRGAEAGVRHFSFRTEAAAGCSSSAPPSGGRWSPLFAVVG